MAEILDGRLVAEEINSETKKQVDQLLEKGVTPTLAIMRANQNPSSVQYEKAAARAMKKVGIETEHVTFSDGISEDGFLAALGELNDSENIHGVLVMQPLPENIDLKTVGQHISPLKDIDGMSGSNLGKIMANDEKAHLPSTAKAVLEIIQHYKLPLVGTEVTVVGKSNTVGKPLSVMLMNEEATVSVCHEFTKDLKEHTKSADILITATGAIGLITKDHVKPGGIVIDVGYSFKDGKAYGDVRYDEVEELVSKITPVPGGVGSVTTAALANQMVHAANWLQKK